MTNEQKLQDYQEMLELVKKHLDVNYEYLTPIRFEVELKKIAEKIDDLSYKVNDLEDEASELEDQVSDLEDVVWGLKKELKKLKNKNLKNNES